MKLIILFVSLILLEFTHERKARCFMVPDKDSGVSGEVNFEQANEYMPVEITIKVFNAKSIHGFHIHEKGNIDGGCMSAGTHFNPLSKNHGSPNSTERHMGDLGNIKSEDGKTIKHSFNDTQISLFGNNSIVGRACVVHAEEDDLGLGENEESLRTGNSGYRLACGVVQAHDPLLAIFLGIAILVLGLGFSLYYFFVYKKNPNKNLMEDEVKHG